VGFAVPSDKSNSDYNMKYGNLIRVIKSRRVRQSRHAA
jgi:hypothetical protein